MGRKEGFFQHFNFSCQLFICFSIFLCFLCLFFLNSVWVEE